MTTICKRCVLPETFPGTSLNSEGICNHCQAAPELHEIEESRKALAVQIEEAVREVKSSSDSDYDCVVAYSGGKDSSYTLYHLKEKFGLNLLAVTIDNGFLSEQAIVNSRKLTASLGIDFILFAPKLSFMSNMYRQSLKRDDVHVKASITRASNICNSCINLINNQMITFALKNKVNLIAGGYLGGQVPKDAAVMKIDIGQQEVLRKKRLEKYRSAFGETASQYFGIPPNLINSENSIITILNPMLTLLATEEEIIEKISEFGWVKTKDTGNYSSNCKINDLGIMSHNKKYGFNPYIMEVAEGVRAGLIDREKALKKLARRIDFEDVEKEAKAIGLNESDFE